MEEFCKANEREYQRLNIPIIDLNVSTILCLVNHVAQTHHDRLLNHRQEHPTHIYRPYSNAQAIFGHASLPFLDFASVDNDGIRIEGGTGLVVFDGRECEPDRYEMEQVGRDVTPNCELEIYFLHPARSYEIRLRGETRQLKTITFPSQVTTTVQCVCDHSSSAMACIVSPGICIGN